VLLILEFSCLLPENFPFGGSKEEVDYFEKNGQKDHSTDCDVSEDLNDIKFKADSSSSRKIGDRFDKNGVFCLACSRHGVPEKLYNVYKGEGQKYILASIYQMLINPNNSCADNFTIMYDIICLRRKAIEKQFPSLLNKNPKYAVSVFHAYANSMSCQVKYHPRYIAGIGYENGEGCERLWSYLNGFASMIRSMSAANRQLVFTDAVDHFIESKMAGLASVIKKTFDRMQSIISVHNLTGKT
jgi:hypothetical protein